MAAPTGTSFLTFLAVAVFTTSLSPAAAQTTIFVDASATGAGDGSSWADAYTAVQPALNAAQPGDQVWVAAGTYVENITLALNVALYGSFAGTEDPATFNLADRDLTADQTLIDGNYHGSVVTAPAGATDSTRIDGFTIVRGNAGVDCDSSSPTIANNVIKGNGRYSVGTGIYLYGSSAIIMNNTITANSTMRGAGVYIEASSPTITNNTITGNSARYGGGVYVDMSTASSPTITNTIIAFNSSGIYATGDAGTAVLSHNCVYGNLQYDYSGLADPTGTEGNLSADPRLASWEFGNVHIQPDSPCANAGDNAYAYGSTDVDGQPRSHPIDGTGDIGADQSDGTTWPVGPYVVVRVSPTGDDDHDGSSWELAKRTVQAGIDAACRSGGEVWVQAGRYDEGIVLHPYAYLYGGFAGGETQRDERDWNANVTTLDGRQNATVVLAFAGHRVSAINGFTIANSSPQSWYTAGGGLYLSSASPTVMNNTIVGNNATYGGGIGAFASFAIIAHNRIMGNRTANHIYVDGSNDLRRGGGLYLM